MQHSQLNIMGQSAPRPEPERAWSPEELRHFWALANRVFGKGQAVALVHDMVAAQCRKDRMHDLDRGEFLRLLEDLKFKSAEDLDGAFKGTAMERPWQRIRWLQRQLKWTDGRLVNHVLWHGRRTGANVDSIRWLTVEKSRGIMVGMQRILDKAKEGATC